MTEKERLETIGNNIPDGALFQFVLDTKVGQMRFSYVNKKWKEITGIPADIAMSNIQINFAMVHPDDLPILMQKIDNSAQTMTVLYAEYRITVNDATRWVQIRCSPHREDTLIVWDGIIIDITQRKEDEHALDIEKMRLQALGDNLPNSALFQCLRDIRTGQMRIVYVSGRWEDITGVPAKDVMNDISNLFDAVHPDDLPALIQSITNSANEMSDQISETRINGRWIDIVARPRREGIYVIWDGIMTDITGRHKT